MMMHVLNRRTPYVQMRYNYNYVSYIYINQFRKQLNNNLYQHIL